MIRKLKILNAILFISLISSVFGQNHSGIITYKGEINQIYVDSFLTALNEKKEVPMHVKQGVVNMYSNAIPEEFLLSFNGNESYYYNIPTLKPAQGYNIGSNAGTDPYYTNNLTDTIIEITQVLGNISHKPLDWEIKNETKYIGDQKCYLATATEKLYSRQGHYYYREVNAWFTPDIPLNFGPRNYKGLPGLILQIKRNDFTLTAMKINLNPSDDVDIKRVEKNDKIITQEESYNRIKELQADRKKRMSNNR